MLKHITTMNTRLINAIEVLGSASRAAAAADSNRQPNARDLDRLGIDPAAFAKIGKS